MHGMLSAGVILAAFAVIALVSGASAVWLFRAAGAAPRRSRSARMARMPDAATGPAPGAPSVPGAPGEPEEEAGGAGPDYPERTWLGAARTATAQLAGPAADGGWPGPGDPAGLAAAGDGDVYDVYDVENWPGAEESGGGPGRRPRGWPDTAKSLYSRGWPVMDSSPRVPDRVPDAGQPRNGTGTGAAGEPHAGEPHAGEPHAGEPHAAAEETGAPGPPDGARFYVLDESRRSGR